MKADDANAGNRIESKEIIMGKNYYNIDYINKYIPEQYRDVAIKSLIEQEKNGIYGAPTDSKRVTGVVGEPTELQSFHTGIDIGSLSKDENGKPIKGDPIYATADGAVLRTAKTANSKSTIAVLSLPYTIDTAVYQHAVSIVETGDIVKRGQVIGYMSDEGTPGQVHLHYEIRKDGLYAGQGGQGELVDPLSRMPKTYKVE